MGRLGTSLINLKPSVHAMGKVPVSVNRKDIRPSGHSRVQTQVLACPSPSLGCAWGNG